MSFWGQQIVRHDQLIHRSVDQSLRVGSRDCLRELGSWAPILWTLTFAQRRLRAQCGGPSAIPHQLRLVRIPPAWHDYATCCVVRQRNSLPFRVKNNSISCLASANGMLSLLEGRGRNEISSLVFLATASAVGIPEDEGQQWLLECPSVSSIPTCQDITTGRNSL